MNTLIKSQKTKHLIYYAVFGVIAITLMTYYFSNTLIHYTSDRQFPIDSFKELPLTILIFPAELFSFLFGMYFVYNLTTDTLRSKKQITLIGKENIPVALLIPVYHEPKNIVDRTLLACSKVNWKGKTQIYLLDDSTNTESKEQMSKLGKKYGAIVVRRADRVGYKAGNLNNAIKNVVKEPYFVIFDSDQAPEPSFLEETMDQFTDPNVGFVQTPQHYIEDKNLLQRAAKIGVNIFYHTQCVSKSNDNAIPFCGTNVVVKTEIFKKVGGFSYYTSTEDIDLGIRINSEGFRGVYVPHILSHGFAPPDYKAYSSQQYRWANGNLAILREYGLKILKGNFPIRYQIHTFFTLGWWLIGLVTLLYITVPLLSLFFGLGTHHTWLPSWLLVLLFFNVALGISMVYVSLNSRVDNEKVKFSDALIQYSLITNSSFLYAKAAFNALILKRYIGFVTTDKKGSSVGLRPIMWNLILSGICFVSSIYALYKGFLGGDIQQIRTFIPLSLWLLFYSAILMSSILFIGENQETKKESV